MIRLERLLNPCILVLLAACSSAEPESKFLADDSDATETAATDRKSDEASAQATPTTAPQTTPAAVCSAPGASCDRGLTCNVVGGCLCGNGNVDPGEECDTTDPQLVTSCTPSCTIPCNAGDFCVPAAGRRGIVDCGTGHRVCQDKGASVETCGDGLDNDGNGLVDDGCVVRVAVSPYRESGPYGQMVYVPCYAVGGEEIPRPFDPKRYCVSKGFANTNGQFQCTTMNLGGYMTSRYVEWVECVR